MQRLDLWLMSIYSYGDFYIIGVKLYSKYWVIVLTFT
jgi:hypothetical protein